MDHIIRCLEGRQWVAECEECDFDSSVSIDPDRFVTKLLRHNVWVANRNHIEKLYMLTFAWSGNTGPIKLHNPYFNGMMFGYPESDIENYYLTSGQGDVNWRKGQHQIHKQAFPDLIRKIKTMPEFREWVDDKFA